jgi:hypothetical protein
MVPSWKIQDFHYTRLPGGYRDKKIGLVDLNLEGRFEAIPPIDFDLHVTLVRLAARLLDPDAFVICSAVMKNPMKTLWRPVPNG